MDEMDDYALRLAQTAAAALDLKVPAVDHFFLLMCAMAQVSRPEPARTSLDLGAYIFVVGTTEIRLPTTRSQARLVGGFRGMLGYVAARTPDFPATAYGGHSVINIRIGEQDIVYSVRLMNTAGVQWLEITDPRSRSDVP